jgi:hypothetical protein
MDTLEKMFRCYCVEERLKKLFGHVQPKAWQNYECPFCKGEEK